METFEVINKTGSKQSTANNFFGTTNNNPPFIQPKLTINQPNDVYEQEADAMADKVMRMEQPGMQLKPLPVTGLQRKCAHCEEEKQMQRKEMNTGEAVAGNNLEHYVGNLNSGGQALPDEVRNFYEPRFGYDFSNVKVHTDTVAAKSAQSINAVAYTSGSNIAFDSGQYSPDTNAGKKLLGHELTHVVQQGAGVSTKKIQRTMGDGHDLNAARFSRNTTLEAVYDDERVLKKGDSGNVVRLTQQALIDSGMSLPRFGVDGDFGDETEAAVITFQRASGLNGGDRDGVIGPTTMGWLDQNFATAPTPAGTTAGATTGCAAFKTIDVDFLSLRGSTRNPIDDLNFANTVFNQCCVRFNAVGGSTASDIDSDAMLGGDTVLNGTIAGATTVEEDNLLNNGGLSARFKVFYVESIDFLPTAYSFQPSSGSAKSNCAFVSNGAFTRSLAHEFGHLLLDTNAHELTNTDNLMNPSQTATGEDLDVDGSLCSTIFANA